MPPSEFIRRAVRFTPFATENAGTIIREGGPELFLFSSDFPHPEGTKNPIERFESTFEGFDEDDEGPLLPPQLRTHDGRGLRRLAWSVD